MCNNHSINSINSATGEILLDKTAAGKERPWKHKKIRSQLTANHFLEAGLVSKSERMMDCADTLVFKYTENTLRLFQAWFCKVRMCPMCNWRRSLKIAYHNKRIVETVNEREKVQWLFLTLTVRNTPSESLSETISGMFKAWNRFVGYKSFKTSVKGYFRALEVTKNRDHDSEWFGTYHPHFHVLLCVPSSYFKKKELYIKQGDWTNLWKRAMRVEYTPIVNVKKVKPKENLKGIEDQEQRVKSSLAEQKAILEVSKYPVKDTDVISGDEVTEENTETVLALDNALSYKRLIGYGGLLKQIHKELNLDDAEEGDLIRVSDDDDMANGTFEVMAKWNIGLGNYLIKS